LTGDGARVTERAVTAVVKGAVGGSRETNFTVFAASVLGIIRRLCRFAPDGRRVGFFDGIFALIDAAAQGAVAKVLMSRIIVGTVPFFDGIFDVIARGVTAEKVALFDEAAERDERGVTQSRTEKLFRAESPRTAAHSIVAFDAGHFHHMTVDAQFSDPSYAARVRFVVRNPNHSFAD